MQRFTIKAAVVILLAILSSNIFAQSDLNIFGFYQVSVQKLKGDFKIYGDVPTPLGAMPMVFDETNDNFTNSGVQQLNIFLRKELTSNLSSFINVELVNNFSTDKNWGSFNLEEVWLNYEYNDALNIKAGYLIPKFNYLNEIKNKTPLLPYIIRPLIYEASLANTLNPSSYLPERAFLQVSGTLPVDKFIFDYAAYAGPAERSYISVSSNGATQPGTDTTNFKLFGGRLGFGYSDLRLGVSFTSDKAKYANDDVNRTRLGFDFGYNIYGLFLEGEYIKVGLDTDKDIDKSFYYGLAGYNFTDQFYGYAATSRIEDKQTDYLSNGMQGYMFGIGFRPTFSVVVKLEYATYFINDNANFTIPLPTGDPANPVYQFPANMDLNYKAITLALSVVF